MKFTAEFVLSVVVALGSGVGAYTAIRADLATLHERSTNALAAAQKANDRIDQLTGRQK